jgi:antitoxin (DNA-binding transcriptional repressor) of toxin-antitoxin stability system
MMSKRAVELRGYEGDLETLVDEAVLGEQLVITRDGEPVAEIIPLRRSKPRERGLAKGMIIIPANFADPLEEFEDYR